MPRLLHRVRPGIILLNFSIHLASLKGLITGKLWFVISSPADCMDAYEHLTCKILAIMTWAWKLKTKKNIDISWLIKADDDIAINAELLAEEIDRIKPDVAGADQIHCHVRWFPAPNRKIGSKW